MLCEAVSRGQHKLKYQQHKVLISVSGHFYFVHDNVGEKKMLKEKAFYTCCTVIMLAAYMLFVSGTGWKFF